MCIKWRWISALGPTSRAAVFKGVDRPARDQLIRASQSIPLNIAEGYGKASAADRGRFLQIANGSARECGAILDILNRCSVISTNQLQHGKALLIRIVSMLTKMTLQVPGRGSAQG